MPISTLLPVAAANATSSEVAVAGGDTVSLYRTGTKGSVAIYVKTVAGSVHSGVALTAETPTTAVVGPCTFTVRRFAAADETLDVGCDMESA